MARKTRVKKHRRNGKIVKPHLRRLKVTKAAKAAAKRALRIRAELSPSKRFGLDESEARRLGINSGVARAKQLIRSDSIPFEDAKSVARFRRFKSCKTKKCQGAKDLWGGDEFIDKANKFVKSFD